MGNGATVTAMNPATNEPIARVRLASIKDYHDTVNAINEEKKRWMATPGPARGEIVR